jgi:hypothetical protein
LVLGFYRLNLNISKAQKQCAASGLATKTVTKNKTEGRAWGRAKKTGGVLINTFKIKISYLLKHLGFLPCGLWVGSLFERFFYLIY